MGKNAFILKLDAEEVLFLRELITREYVEARRLFKGREHKYKIVGLLGNLFNKIHGDDEEGE